MRRGEIETLCRERRWTRSRLVLELRRVGRRVGEELPGDDSLKRMIREWNSGRRSVSDLYQGLLTELFGVPESGDVHLGPDAPRTTANQGELVDRLATAAAADGELVHLFEQQTDLYRQLDRRMGARLVLARTEAHVAQMADVLTYSLPGGVRDALGAAVAAAASLAGWQALDLGSPNAAWRHYETAKAAARDSGSPALLAHATAEQAFTLLDAGQPARAVALIKHARETAGSGVPTLLRAWLLAAEAESSAAAGAEVQSRRAMDDAYQRLPDDPIDPALPFVFLSDVHLARWRGHCLAQMGAAEAIDDLTDAVSRLDPTFTRAAAGLHCDLALAHSVRGDHEAAREEAQHAEALAAMTASVRQQRRISRLMASGQRLRDH
jgi:tetratricopeptide (TPR) repeat protein